MALRSGLSAIALRATIRTLPPTDENLERWDCDCGGVNRILTGEQIRMKFAHLSAAAKARREGRPLPWDDPAWQERIRQAKQRVAEHEQSDD